MVAFHSPIEQFEVHNLSPTLFSLGGHPIAFTNAALAMILAVVLSASFMILSTRRRAVIPGRWQILAESFYNAIGNTLTEAAGEKSKPFMPFIYTLFCYILFCNLLGMMPGVYTPTSQLIVNLALAATVILVVIGSGIAKHGVHFFSLFVPKGAPMVLLPFLTVLELISFFVRPFSLSLRLFGNMLAGHILLKVFAGMSAAVATEGVAGVTSVFPVVLNIIIIAFEFFVALLQAYIFTVLSSVYLRDALELH
jgi:F-type H+-transporting ATPase subunit a